MDIIVKHLFLIIAWSVTYSTLVLVYTINWTVKSNLIDLIS